jgi:hypothetical protein
MWTLQDYYLQDWARALQFDAIERKLTDVLSELSIRDSLRRNMAEELPKPKGGLRL